MKTLKEELQAIIDNYRLSLSFGCYHICNFLSVDNAEVFEEYFEMSKKYAPEFHCNDMNSPYGWWKIRINMHTNESRVISEKYRFIQDLIKILP